MQQYHNENCRCYESQEHPSREEIALHFNLWREFVDPDCHDKRHSWEKKSLKTKLTFMEKCLGKEEE